MLRALYYSNDKIDRMLLFIEIKVKRGKENQPIEV